MKMSPRASGFGPGNQWQAVPLRFASAFSGSPCSTSRSPLFAAVFGLAVWLLVSAATGTESMGTLCQRLQNSRSFVERLRAAEALAEYGDRAVSVLRGLLRHPDSRGQEFAAVALGRIGPEAGPAALQPASHRLRPGHHSWRCWATNSTTATERFRVQTVGILAPRRVSDRQVAGLRRSGNRLDDLCSTFRTASNSAIPRVSCS